MAGYLLSLLSVRFFGYRYLCISATVAPIGVKFCKMGGESDVPMGSAKTETFPPA